MTTDNFTTAASAEAERWYPDLREDSRHEYGAEGFAVGAEWARTYLAEQEPTEDVVQAAVAAILALTGESEETARLDDIDQAWDHARAALTAARSPEGA